MKHCTSVVLLLACAIGLFAGEPPVRNLDFSQKGSDGKFTFWSQRGGAAEYKAENGTLTVTPQAAESVKLLMQYPIELQPGGIYRFSFERCCPDGMKSCIYIEYRNAENKLRGFYAGSNPTGNKWVQEEINFTMPEQFTGAYMVIMTGPGKAPCQFRNLKMECKGTADFASASRMKAAEKCFATPVDASSWRKLGAASGTAEFADNTLKLKLNAAKGTMFYLKQLKLKPGVKYGFSTKVRLGKGQYAFYLEYSNAQGRRPSINGSFLTARGVEAFPVSFTGTMPEGASNIVIVLSAKDAPEPVEFSDLQIRELSQPADPASVSSWQGGIKEPAGGGRFKLVIPDGKTVFSRVQLRKGQFYRFSFDGVTRKSKDLTGFASFQFRAKMNGKDFFVSDRDDLLNGRGSSKQVTFQAPASGMGIFEISSRGEIVLNAMRMEEVNPSEASCAVLELAVPAYRNTIFDDQREEVSGKLTLKKPAVSAEITLANEASPDSFIVQRKSRGGFFKLRETRTLPAGQYSLTVTPMDAAGKKLQGVSTAISIIKRPAVCFQYKPEDNTFYLNGKPVHYHGFMHGYSPELVWLYQYYGVLLFAEHAGNPVQLLQDLDKAQKLGFRLMFSLRADPYVREKRDFMPDWKRYIDCMLTPQVLNHPALAGYISADEPAWCNIPVEYLKAITEYVHKKDPTRPVWINEAPRGSVELNSRFAAHCDAFGVDIYPIPYPNNHSGLEDKTITSVGAYTRRCREAAGPLKPIWMVLQGFAWNDLHQKPDAVYPTAEESRYMALEAMANGANADIYYGINHIRNAKFYVEILKTVSEVCSLSRLWQAGNTLKVKAAPGMKIFAGIVDGERYIVALNTTPAAMDSRMDLTGLYELPAGTPAKNTRFDKYTARVFASVPRYPGDFNKRPAYDKTKEAQALAALNRMFAPAAKYQGKAQWIWYPGDAKALSCKSTLALDFNLKAPVAKACLLAGADDTGVVTLNGKKLGKAGSWRMMKNFNVKPILKPGKNRIEVEVAGTGTPPSGLLADLLVEYTDGTAESFVSGPDWQAIKPGQPVKKAEVIAPYGRGAWGSKVEYYLH